MIPVAFAYLGTGFLFSEIGLAIWRRASSKENTENRDKGSLRLLWIVISASITAGAFLAANGVRPWLPAGFPSGWLGVSVFVLGTALRWWSIRHLGRFFTVNVAVASDHRVVDTGPYRFVRHPSYSGLLLQFIGLGLTLGTLPALLAVVVLPTAAILYRIRIEEAALRAHLSTAYVAYAARTKKIVPLFFDRRKAVSIAGDFRVYGQSKSASKLFSRVVATFCVPPGHRNRLPFSHPLSLRDGKSG